ncbi:MAG: AAA family ATPase [Syntrophobacteraceae bacterium]
MPSGKVLRQLIKAGSSGDVDAFKQVSETVIREERQKQHHLLANDLEKILYGHVGWQGAVSHRLSEHVPVDSERGLKLLYIKEPGRNMDDVVLSPENRNTLEEILEQHHREDVLKSYGLRPVDKILFCGPPGCGKTLTAEVIALELGRPLAMIRIDSVVSSYLGETAANLRKVFDFIDSAPMVALFDEFDALGKEREDRSEHGELKRVVNAVLQMLDAYQGKALIIAATNHEQMLDSAIWRRFEEVLLFDLPSREELLQLLQIKLRGVRREFETADDRVLSLFSGMTHAEVERVLRRSIKEMILKGQEFLQVRFINKAIQREQAQSKKISGRK